MQGRNLLSSQPNFQLLHFFWKPTAHAEACDILTYWQRLNSERALGPPSGVSVMQEPQGNGKKPENFHQNLPPSCTVEMGITALSVQELLIRKHSFRQHKRLKSGGLKVVLIGTEKTLTLETLNRQKWDTQELSIICYFSQTWHLKSIKTTPCTPCRHSRHPQGPPTEPAQLNKPPTWAVDTQTTGIKK